jgi:hypothetical protein
MPKTLYQENIYKNIKCNINTTKRFRFCAGEQRKILNSLPLGRGQHPPLFTRIVLQVNKTKPVGDKVNS